MKRMTFLTMAVLVLGFGLSIGAAQDKAKSQTAIGPVAKIAGDVLIIDAGKGQMQFMTSTTTEIKVAAGGAKQQAAKLEGKKGLKITEVVHVGDQVFVRYNDVGGKLMALEVEVRERRPASAQPVK